MPNSREEYKNRAGSKGRTIHFRGQEYYDDRISVLHLCAATVKPNEEGLIVTTIYHDQPPDDHIWCVAFYRNFANYPLYSVTHFSKKEDAITYVKEIEPWTPLVSLNGNEPLHPVSYEEYLSWKEKNNFKEYNFKTVCLLPGGTNGVEHIVQTKEQFKGVKK